MRLCGGGAEQGGNPPREQSWRPDSTGGGRGLLLRMSPNETKGADRNGRRSDEGGGRGGTVGAEPWSGKQLGVWLQMANAAEWEGGGELGPGRGALKGRSLEEQAQQRRSLPPRGRGLCVGGDDKATISGVIISSSSNRLLPW